jgi:sulfur carrier protein
LLDSQQVDAPVNKVLIFSYNHYFFLHPFPTVCKCHKHLLTGHRSVFLIKQYARRSLPPDSSQQMGVAPNNCIIVVKLTFLKRLYYTEIALGEAERPESPDKVGRPLEPDPGHAGVGNGKGDRILQGCGFFVFMQLIVNGESLELSDVKTLRELLEKLQIDPSRVIVEINLSLVRKSEYPTFRLNAGDKVEIVNFVGGG